MPLIEGRFIADNSIDGDDKLVGSSVGTAALDLGTGAGQLSADDVPIEDTGSNLAATDIEAALAELAEKRMAGREKNSSFDGVTASGLTTTVFDAAIKLLTNHNNGLGSSTVEGVILNGTNPHIIPIRNATTKSQIDDGLGNQVYARLTAFTAGQYVVSFFSDQDSAGETAFNLASTSIDLAFALASRKAVTKPFFGGFIGEGFVETVSGTLTINDENIVTDGFTDMLTGLVTQEQVNQKVDNLGSTTAGQGSALVAMAALSNLLTGTNDVQDALVILDKLGDSTAGQGANLVVLDFAPTAGNLLDGDVTVGDALDTLDTLPSVAKLAAHQKWVKSTPITLIAGDITNAFADLAGGDAEIRDLTANTAELFVDGLGNARFTVDYITQVDGAAANKRINWSGLNLDGVLIAGDVLSLRYAVKE